MSPPYLGLIIERIFQKINGSASSLKTKKARKGLELDFPCGARVMASPFGDALGLFLS